MVAYKYILNKFSKFHVLANARFITNGKKDINYTILTILLYCSANQLVGYFSVFLSRFIPLESLNKFSAEAHGHAGK